MSASVVKPLVAALACVAPWLPSAAQDASRAPLPRDHPLIGVWRIDVPGTGCHELYDFRADGTLAVTSGAQAVTTEIRVDAAPSDAGFYRWIDKVVQDNGKPDCMGEVGQVGHTATHFITFHPSRRQFMLCRKPSMDECIGPFLRQGSDI
jgi:hypothetical protein